MTSSADELDSDSAIILAIFQELGLITKPSELAGMALNSVWDLYNDGACIGKVSFYPSDCTINIRRRPYHEQTDEEEFNLADPDSIRKIECFLKAWNI